MRYYLHKTAIQLHLATAAIVIMNAIIKWISPYHLVGDVELGLKGLLLLSGLLLFLFHFRPFNKFSFYLAIYPLFVAFLTLGLAIRGVFGVVVLSFLLFLIEPEIREKEEAGIMITTPFKRFMAPCCSYRVSERKFLILAHDYELWELNGEGPIDFDTVKISIGINEIEIAYTTLFDKGLIKHKRIVRRG